jgi:glycosyltransferase involved in cell wall biosynthesis
MARLVLTQIMKNEAHVITRMLNSIRPIVDIICLVDTGSTDNSIEVVKNWGEQNKIETHVFERPFDNFENSRNYSIQMAREVTAGRGNDFWGFWLDADEMIEILPNFNKNNINKDLYMFNTYINVMKYTRNECYKLDKPFRFYGPVHEFIVCDEKNITSGLMDGLNVRVQMDGGSWKGNIPEKYKSHAFVLEKYIDANRQDPRWIFYTAQSYHDSACVPDNRQENEERLRRSMKYYKERISRNDGYPEEIFYSQFRLGTIMRVLEMPFSDTLNELLKAYSIDPLRAEPIKAIIDHYLSVGEWNNAYLFSKFAKVNFHGKNPYPQRLLFVDEALYIWKILEVHAAASFYTGRRDEAKQAFSEMVEISRQQPQYFTQEDLQKIQMNSQFFA